MDGYSKMSIYIRPTLESCLKKNIFPSAGFDCVASWVIYARRSKSGHCSVQYHEPFWEKLAPMIVKGNEVEISTDKQIWGDLPSKFNSFVPRMVDAIKKMDKKWPT